MRNECDVAEWTRLADMDVLSANHLNEIRHPKPLEMICYHCQQAAEKMLKALVLVVPAEYIAKYPQQYQSEIWSVKKFIEYVRECEG